MKKGLIAAMVLICAMFCACSTEEDESSVTCINNGGNDQNKEKLLFTLTKKSPETAAPGNNREILQFYIECLEDTCQAKNFTFLIKDSFYYLGESYLENSEGEQLTDSLISQEILSFPETLTFKYGITSISLVSEVIWGDLPEEPKMTVVSPRLDYYKNTDNGLVSVGLFGKDVWLVFNDKATYSGYVSHGTAGIKDVGEDILLAGFELRTDGSEMGVTRFNFYHNDFPGEFYNCTLNQVILEEFIGLPRIILEEIPLDIYITQTYYPENDILYKRHIFIELTEDNTYVNVDENSTYFSLKCDVYAEDSCNDNLDSCAVKLTLKTITWEPIENGVHFDHKRSCSEWMWEGCPEVIEFPNHWFWNAPY